MCEILDKLWYRRQNGFGSSIKPKDADLFSGKAAIDKEEQEFLEMLAAKGEGKGRFHF